MYVLITQYYIDILFTTYLFVHCRILEYVDTSSISRTYCTYIQLIFHDILDNLYINFTAGKVKPYE